MFKIDFVRRMTKLMGLFPANTPPKVFWKNSILIQSFVSRGSVAIKVNDDTGNYFHTKKELRLGDPLSPLLFNIVTDMLAILIKRAKDDGQIERLLPYLIDGRLSILQTV